MILQMLSTNHKKSLYRLILFTIMLMSLVGLVLLSSCEKKEPLWELPPPGEEEIATVTMGETYNNTIFFQFETGNTIVRDINTFHLAFESSSSGFRIKTNAGRNVQVHNTGNTDFSIVLTASASTAWAFDLSNGNLDSTAIGNWLVSDTSRVSKQEVYIIDMGIDAVPKYRKFQLIAVDDTSYTLKHANLDNTDSRQFSFLKKANYTFTYLDLLTDQTILYEPLPEEYDIVFTKYKHIFIEDGAPLPYSVNGVLLNPANTYGAKANNSFVTLDYSVAAGLLFTPQADVVGYDWKYYDIDNNKFSIVPNLYAVKDAKGVLWKLEFLDFYNDAGVKGSPRFRFQRL